MSNVWDIQRTLQKFAKPARAKASAWFFKTAPGQYGHGDRFLGITVPEQRRVARQYRDVSLLEVIKLLKSPFHEHRLTAVIILVDQFRRANQEHRKKIFRVYLSNKRFVNNWDIVDSSAGYIVGEYLLDHPKTVLQRLARSRSLWDRRIAIIATQAFIRRGRFETTLKLARVLLHDQHDLIQKAVGWMLREVGNRDVRALRAFLKRDAHRMPRTMLRYAIEKLPQTERQRWLSG